MFPGKRQGRSCYSSPERRRESGSIYKLSLDTQEKLLVCDCKKEKGAYEHFPFGTENDPSPTTSTVTADEAKPAGTEKGGKTTIPVSKADLDSGILLSGSASPDINESWVGVRVKG